MRRRSARVASVRPLAVIYTLVSVGLLLLVALVWFARGWGGRWRTAVQIERASRTLAAEQERVEREFFEKAASTGKPRGLKWVECNFHEGALLAYDRTTEEIYALRGVTIRFEAIPGGGMEEVEAVGNLRYATAVFVFSRNNWTTDGRVVFNLGPEETLEKYRDSLTPLAA